jgi:hypothetical protein
MTIETKGDFSASTPRYDLHVFDAGTESLPGYAELKEQGIGLPDLSLLLRMEFCVLFLEPAIIHVNLNNQRFPVLSWISSIAHHGLSTHSISNEAQISKVVVLSVYCCRYD